MTVTTLPLRAGTTVPRRDIRWIPTRAGILNVWRYYDEVFEFHRGRLLLRGPNGSGKSKALELLLPFLFDASLRANRLSTFGTAERTMHWNLMGEGATGTTRVGYVWLEFERAGTGWFTCGARLQASNHTTTVHSDYFTTSRRIGTPDGIALTTDGRPLTRAALAERLGTDGAVYDSAADYRNAVRANLFPTLDEQRYDALITALLQLRMPKLSQRLDPSLLSTLLSRALPPLDHNEIAELAEGFERLDAQRKQLAQLDAEAAATRTLARQQKTYARCVLRAAAATVLTASSELDRLSEAATRSAGDHAHAAATQAAALAELQALEAEYDDAEARKDGLLRSELYQQGQQWDALRGAVETAGDRAGTLEAGAARSRGTADSDLEKARMASEKQRRRRATAQARRSEAHRAAHTVGMSSIFEELDDSRSRSLLRGTVRGRRSQLDELSRCLDAHDRAVEARTTAEQWLEQSRAASESAAEAASEATAAHDRAMEELRNRLSEWMNRCRELVTVIDRDALVAQTGNTAAVQGIVAAATIGILDNLARRETRCQDRLDAATRAREPLAEEHHRLSAEQDMPPAAPYWRTTDRSRMPGAPLWRLIDFTPAVPEHVRGGIEAALEASGLLDAWVGPRAEITGHDVFADPDAMPPASGRSLADVLIVRDGTMVNPSAIRKLLTTIAFGQQLPAGPVAVGADGSWRVGALTGTWSKPQPALVGTLSQQRAHEQRIRQLQTMIAEIDHSIADCKAELREITSRRDAVAAEAAACPEHDTVIAARELWTRAAADLAAAEQGVTQRAADLAERERRVRDELTRLSGRAAEHGLPVDRTALATLGTALDSFGTVSETWLDACLDVDSAAIVADQLADRATEADERARTAATEASTARAEHRRKTVEFETISHTAGLEHREILEQLGRLRTRLRDLDRDVRAARSAVLHLAEHIGESHARSSSDAGARDRAARQLESVSQRFHQLASTPLPVDAELPEPDSFRAALIGADGVHAVRDAALQVAEVWQTVPHAPGDIAAAAARLVEAVHECRTVLNPRADLDLEIDQDVQVFTAVVDGLRLGAVDLLATLDAEAARARDGISDREQQLFDRTLTGETRRHLADRIRQATELVDAMNARLERVRTASNVAVRLVWQVAQELPPDTETARDLLLQDPSRLTDADHEALHRFLRDRIDAVAAQDTAAGWEQQLSQIFDYTAWHRFVVEIDRGNGAGWQLLTKRLHGALSGGEKAIALHLPLFAAVAAHYQSAPAAPRPILLDEVFVGVDTANRGQIFALLAALDLDLVLTSDHEWCTYAELDGIGIHQILTDDDDAVTTARFTWNGHDLLPS